MVVNIFFDIGLEKLINIICSIGFLLFFLDREEDFDIVWKCIFVVIDYVLYVIKLLGRNGWVGVIEMFKILREYFILLDMKFNFFGLRIVILFNNVVSIKWLEIFEKQQQRNRDMYRGSCSC